MYKYLQDRIKLTGGLGDFTRFLLNVLVIAVIFFVIVSTRTQFVVVDEVHMLRLDIASQIAALRASGHEDLQDADKSLSHIDVNSKVLIDRLDSQMSQARLEINKASKVTQQNSKAESAQLTKTLTDTLATTTQAINVVADHTDDSSKTPVQVIVPKQDAPKVVTVPQSAPTQIVPPLEIQPKKHKSWLRRICFFCK